MATYRLISQYDVPNQPDYPPIPIGQLIEGEPILLPTLKVEGIQYYYVLTGRQAVGAEIPLTKLLKISDDNLSNIGEKKFNANVGIKYGLIALFSLGVILIVGSLFKKKKK